MLTKGKHDAKLCEIHIFPSKRKKKEIFLINLNIEINKSLFRENLIKNKSINKVNRHF